jgi:ribonuclease VapC
VEPFTDIDALATAALYPRVSSRGLSAGDRACLALAQRLGAPAATGEHLWADLPLDVAVQLIRPPRG